MSDLINDVREFHRACGDEHPTKPTFEHYVRKLRSCLLSEEYWELQGAIRTCMEPSAAEIAKEICDLIYVAIGTALAFGIPLERVWDAVHASNMAKVKDGVKRRADGKIIKPDGWQKPNIAEIIGE